MTLIKGLNGVGAKKARDLVEFLELRAEDEEGGRIESLAQLRSVPGLGGRTVERMLEGVEVRCISRIFWGGLDCEVGVYLDWTV